jgi:hypothetical protein
VALTVTIDEEYPTSRRFNVSRESTNQDVLFYICGNFLEEMTASAEGFYDDDVLALQAAYDVLPSFISVPAYGGGNMILTISNLDLDQMSWDVWKARVTYSVPTNGGHMGGGGNTNIGNVGPGAGENDGAGWGQNFTQVSCSLTATQRNKKTSLEVKACQRSIHVPAGGVPYTVGEPAPIGHTRDGIEGTEVYEREFSFQITAYFPPSKLKYAYVRRLARMQTTINNAVFFGFPAGSVLFLEADFSGDIYQVVPVTFAFHVRNNYKFSQTEATKLADPNEDDPTLMYDVYNEPDFPDTLVQSGWSMVDYRYSDLPDDTNKMVLQRPLIRTIHKLYGLANFDRFEL